jgi:hypothetical protein
MHMLKNFLIHYWCCGKKIECLSLADFLKAGIIVVWKSIKELPCSTYGKKFYNIGSGWLRHNTLFVIAKKIFVFHLYSLKENIVVALSRFQFFNNTCEEG